MIAHSRAGFAIKDFRDMLLFPVDTHMKHKIPVIYTSASSCIVTGIVVELYTLCKMKATTSQIFTKAVIPL